MVRRGSESEHVRYPLGEIVLGRHGIYLDGRQSQTRRLLAEGVCEHPVAFEQVTQGPLRVTGFGEESPSRSAPALEHRPTEVGRREKPDGTTWDGEEGLDEAWQQPEPLDDDAGLAREAEEVFDD